MKFNIVLSVLFIITFLFQVQSSQPTLAQQVSTGFPQVDLGPGFTAKQISFATKFYNSSIESNYTSLVNNWGTTFGNSSDISGSITSDSLSNTRVLTIFGSQTESSSTETDAVRTALDQGKGLLYMVDTFNASLAAQKFFGDLFNTTLINFTYYEIPGSSYSGQLPYVVATEFSSPQTPMTTNVTKLIFPHVVGMTINTSAIPKSNITIKDIYPVVFDSHTNKILGLAVEVGDYGRILILGSAQIFSNDMFNSAGDYANITGVSNKLFALNIINWLGRGTGYFKMYGYSLNVQSLQTIARGKVITGTVNVTDDLNQTLHDVETRFEIRIYNQILDYNYMTYIGNNTYSGFIETRKVDPGFEIDIHVELVKRGYVQQNFLIGRVYVQLELIGPSLPDLSLITTLAGGIFIFLISGAYVWREFKKTGI